MGGIFAVLPAAYWSYKTDMHIRPAAYWRRRRYLPLLQFILTIYDEKLRNELFVLNRGVFI